jgi:ribonuclease P protein component
VTQPTLTLKRDERINKKADFEKIYKEGSSVVSPYFVVIYLKNSLPFTRLAISIKKKFGKAHKRNKLRRIIKEIFRKNKQSVRDHYDILIIPRKGLSDSFDEKEPNYSFIKRQLFFLFESIGKKDEKNINQNN